MDSTFYQLLYDKFLSSLWMIAWKVAINVFTPKNDLDYEANINFQTRHRFPQPSWPWRQAHNRLFHDEIGRLRSAKNTVLILFEIWNEPIISIVTYGYLKNHYKNLISHFVSHNQISYVSWDLHTMHHYGNSNIRKDTITWMPIPMSSVWNRLQ